MNWHLCPAAMCFCLWLCRTQSLWLDRCPEHHTARVFLLGLPKVWYFKNIPRTWDSSKSKFRTLHANETRLVWIFFPLLISMILSMSIRTITWYSAVTTVYKKFNCTFCYPWLLHYQLSRNLMTAPATQGPSLAVTAAWVHFLITNNKIHPQRKKNKLYCLPTPRWLSKTFHSTSME